MRRFTKLLCLFALVLGLSGQSSNCTGACTLAKTPFEIFNWSLDFAPQIGTDGATLISVTAQNAQGADQTATLVGSSPAPAIQPGTSKVVFQIQNGTVGQQYTIRVRISDNTTGERLEGVLKLQVTN